MESLVDRLKADLTTALKARDSAKADVVRMLLTRLKLKETEKGRGSLDDDAAQQVLASYAKQRKDAAGEFAAAGRQDLHDKEMRERDIVLAYLPKMLDDDAIRAALRSLIADVGAKGPQEMGKVMKPAMEKLRGKAEGARVQQLLRELLGG
jgi:uncharacterized protein YqeY